MKVEELRKVMGTVSKKNVELKTNFYEGVKGIKVELIDYPKNPYKAMFIMATSTWGDHINKWKEVTPEARFFVVKSVLDFRALPLAMESPSFTFAIEGCSRSAFDQIARARIGSVFASMGWRDNDHSDIGFRVPQSIFDDPTSNANFMESCLIAKKEYHRLVQKGQASWQDARAILPISACHNFSMAMNLMALKNFSGKRLKACEQADTVATAWLIRSEIKSRFPLFGSYLRPSCDWRGTCEYHREYAMSEAFGCLFKECGRNKCEATDEYAEFNYACSDLKTIAKQTGLFIPGPKEDLPETKYENLLYADKQLFEGE